MAKRETEDRETEREREREREGEDERSKSVSQYGRQVITVDKSLSPPLSLSLSLSLFDTLISLPCGWLFNYLSSDNSRPLDEECEEDRRVKKSFRDSMRGKNRTHGCATTPSDIHVHSKKRDRDLGLRILPCASTRSQLG